MVHVCERVLGAGGGRDGGEAPASQKGPFPPGQIQKRSLRAATVLLPVPSWANGPESEAVCFGTRLVSPRCEWVYTVLHPQDVKLSLLDLDVNCTSEKLAEGLHRNCGNTGLLPQSLSLFICSG